MPNLQRDYDILKVKNFSQAINKAERIIEECFYYGHAHPYEDREIKSAYNIINALVEIDTFEKEQEEYEYMQEE